MQAIPSGMEHHYQHPPGPMLMHPPMTQAYHHQGSYHPWYHQPAPSASFYPPPASQSLGEMAHYSGPGLSGPPPLYSMQHAKPSNMLPPIISPPKMPPASSDSMYNAAAAGTLQRRQQYGGIGQCEPLPSSPRGPPSKPKQSGWAVWVGNLPPAVTVIQLKDFFSNGAKEDIESVFLMARTNCAFVNYRTEVACIEATQRFDGSQFRGNRIVCRMRQNSIEPKNRSVSRTPSLSAVPALSDAATPSSSSAQSSGRSDTPVIVGLPTSKQPPEPSDVSQLNTSLEASTSALENMSLLPKVKARFFVLKSLTLQDLLVSTRDGAWMTQAHNETRLDEAFRTAEKVYLLFSVNKSGQYFGYAEMASPIGAAGNQESTTTNSSDSPATQFTHSAGQTESALALIPTPATDTAPAGRVVDDSERGTIFWEALRSKEDESSISDSRQNSQTSRSGGGGGEKPFAIRWLSTTCVPFQATRGLRNPLNANREIKIARDGTEVDQAVGWRMLQLFHRRPGAAGEWC